MTNASRSFSLSLSRLNSFYTKIGTEPSNFLPNGGNGTYTLHARVTDDDGNTTSLGTKTIGVSNASSPKPFGTLDTPGQGQTVSGSAYMVWG